MFEQTFKNIDDVLYKDSGADSELDYIGQTSWVLFLRYLDELERDKADEAALMGRDYSFILDAPYRWETWAVPKLATGETDHHNALTGPDLVSFVDGQLFPYLAGFKQRADNPQTIEYKIGEIFSELGNKIQSGYNLREVLDYAERLDIRFSYATNGLQIYGVDMETGVEGDVSGFPTPSELWARTFPEPKAPQQAEAARWAARFFSVPFEDRGGTWQPRYYQENAITRVLEAVAAGRERVLLTLATGTGKTAIAFQIAWKLFQAKWNLRRDAARSPRILFLADRNILADQAFNAFGAFEEDALVRIAPAEIAKKGAVPKNGSVFFTIFQTFRSGPDNSPYFGEYPPDFFDFIVIDECHRGGARDESSWRAILEYFAPAVQLGLTATPKRDVNADTYDYFGEPVYSYALKTGINDGFLTPFKVKEISTTLDSYIHTPDDSVSGEIEAGREYVEGDFNRVIEIREREAYRVQLLLREINQQQKTLVFCATQTHAALVRDLINQHSDSKNVSYCARVTADDGGTGEQYLRDFQDNEKRIPTVLTTSQKLSTGVDAPEIRNIALLRPVKSMVEFKQIVGRGTRLFDGKDYFTIYDFVKAHKHFQDPEWDGEPLEPESIETREAEPCTVCGEALCTCVPATPAPCPDCGQPLCVCEKPPRALIRVTLADNKVRELDSMIKTSFWSPTGAPISAEQFIKQLFDDLPGFFSSEAELRRIWKLPGTRRKLLEALSDKGYSAAQLSDLQKLVHGEDSDLFDVLSYVAYHRDLVPRLDRASHAKIQLGDYDAQQIAFLDFVLEQYVRDGVNELDDAKLADLLTLKYGSLSDAKAELGDVGSIRDVFVDFQQHLYEQLGQSVAAA